jgi:pyrroloquinoline quinone (PQQ) biosynthesis protein C
MQAQSLVEPRVGAFLASDGTRQHAVFDAITMQRIEDAGRRVERAQTRVIEARAHLAEALGVQNARHSTDIAREQADAAKLTAELAKASKEIAEGAAKFAAEQVAAAKALNAHTDGLKRYTVLLVAVGLLQVIASLVIAFAGRH